MNYIYRIYLKITKFIYYGYYGSACVDFDADCIHILIYAHIKRVNRFMHNPKKTHLVWNSNRDNKGMRRLREFSELSKRMYNNGLSSHYFLDKKKELLGIKFLFLNLSERSSKRDRILMRAAMKRDRLVVDFQTKRYYYMLEKYVGGFWD